MRPITIGQAQTARRASCGDRVTWPRYGLAVLAGMVFALGVGASEAQPARSDQVTISLLANFNAQAGFEVLIANFERVYPNIAVNATYAPQASTLAQIETTEIAAGNAPDVLSINPGCGTVLAVCSLGKAGDLAAMVKKPWLRWSMPLVVSASKYGPSLFVYVPGVSLFGLFTNDDLFRRLGLKIPKTFPQLLELCRRAKAAGTVAVILSGNSTQTYLLILDLALNTVYASDRHWNRELKAGTVSFDGAPGWRQALQEFVDMNTSGCFQPGAAGTSPSSGAAEFAQGQGLTYVATSSQKGAIDAAGPQFAYGAVPFPAGADPSRTWTMFNAAGGLSVNAHSSAQQRAAAQTFVDFVARPEQDALSAKLGGSLTQYQLLHAQIPEFMSAFVPVLAAHQYAPNPSQSWWNAGVVLALQQDAIGLITGQETIDDVLNAMDAAWQQGPS
jgi:raffinose/stachyose/melibiose transport system substrate-binding protein